MLKVLTPRGRRGLYEWLDCVVAVRYPDVMKVQPIKFLRYALCDSVHIRVCLCV